MQESTELDLRGYLHILRRRWWVVVLVPTIVTGVALAWSLSKTPQYRASTEILIARTQAEALFDPVRGSIDPNRLLNNEIRVIDGEDVRSEARDRLGFAAEVSARAADDEDVITITAVSTVAAEAAEIANTFADVYLERRRESGADQLAVARAELQRQIDAVQVEIDAVESGETDGDAAVAPQTLVTQLAALREQLIQLEAAANVNRGGAQILSPARVPESPFEPQPTRSGLLGFVVGLMLALGFAFLLDYLDDRVRSKDDVERASGGLPVLGLVPVHPWKRREEAKLVSVAEPQSPAAEAYRSLRTSVRFLGLDRPLRCLQVTSPAESEGKTTTVANLAVALARAGQRVVVVDCDLRRPRLHAFFGVEPDAGFTSVLLGEVPLGSALRMVPGQDHLAVLATGPLPPDPSDLLSGARTREVLAALEAQADIVLVDSPPVLPVSDAVVLSSHVDATLLVVNAGRTTKRPLHRAIEMLTQVDARVIGTVLNGAPADAGYGYGYGYSYSQSSTRRLGVAPGEPDPLSGNGHPGSGSSPVTSASAERRTPEQ